MISRTKFLFACVSLLFLASPARSAAQAATRLPQAATRLEALRLVPDTHGMVAVLQGDGPLDYRIVEEEGEDARFVLDMLGVVNQLRHYYPPDNHPYIERILMYEYPESPTPGHPGPLARIVFELKSGIDFRIDRDGNTLRILFTEEPVGRAPAAAADPGQPAAPRTEPEERGSEPPMGMPTFGEPSAAAAESLAPEVPHDVDGDAADLPDSAGAPSDDAPPSADVAPSDPNIPEDVSIQPEDIDARIFFRPAPASTDDYRLGPEDVVDVRVFELDQLNRTVRVSGDGTIDLPLVGSLRAAGLRSEDVAEQIADRLRDRFVQNPQVSIFVKEFNSQKVSLLGAVQSPSSYPLAGQRRLLQLLAEAGSLTSEAGNTLYVFRQTVDGRSARLTVPLTQLMVHGDPRWNILLAPGDVVSVPPEAAIAVSVLGAVNDPGVHKLPVGDEATLLKAVALAGGLNERASKSLQIKRRGAYGKETVIKVNIGDLLSGKKPDVVLVEGDVVLVKESFF